MNYSYHSQVALEIRLCCFCVVGDDWTYAHRFRCGQRSPLALRRLHALRRCDVQPGGDENENQKVLPSTVVAKNNKFRLTGENLLW